MRSYEVKVTVALHLDAESPQPTDRIRLAARQAVSNALQFAHCNGFEHCLANEASIDVRDVAIVSVSPCNSDTF